jgi:hypothetical protein
MITLADLINVACRLSALIGEVRNSFFSFTGACAIKKVFKLRLCYIKVIYTLNVECVV